LTVKDYLASANVTPLCIAWASGAQSRHNLIFVNCSPGKFS
jgi:hypothetical protein